MKDTCKLLGSKIKTMKVKLKKVKEGAKVPTYGSKYSAGADLYACLESEVSIAPHATVMIPTGLAMELPVGYAGLIYARSGLASKKGLAPANKVGVVDSDYRGEVMVALHNHSEQAQTVADGERIAQIVITPYLAANFVVAEELSSTVRGEGGFGSTGNK